MMDLLGLVRSIVETKLFDVGNTAVTVSTLITVGAILVVTILVSRAIRHAVSRVLQRTRGGSEALGTITGLLHYIVLLFGFGIALQTVGIDLSALFAAGALFAVALGFAMQSITQNFVAGVILLSERAIKPGDVLLVEGKLVKVLDMGIRAITAETRDGEHLIVPNAVLIGSTVTNYTLSHSAVRIRVLVGVVYSSPMDVVKQTLESVAQELTTQWGTQRKPVVYMTQFGDNSVNFEIRVWIVTPWDVESFRAQLHEAVWWAFQEKHITIAFPQLDVHLDPAITAGLAHVKDVVA